MYISPSLKSARHTLSLRIAAVLLSLLLPLTGCDGTNSELTGDGGVDARTGQDGEDDDPSNDEETLDNGGMDASSEDSGMDASSEDGGIDASSEDGGVDPSSEDGGMDASSEDGGVDAPSEDGGMDASLDDDAGHGDGGDAAQDAAPDHDAHHDPHDAAHDGAAEADASGTTCDEACPYALCAGSACAVTQVANAGADARDLAVIGGGYFWTTAMSVRYCTPSSCPKGGAAMSVPDGSHSYGVIIGLNVGGTDYLFVTDNQNKQGLWRAETDGDPFSKWGNANNNSRPLAAFGNVVVWGDQNRTYRGSADDESDYGTTVMNIGPSRNHNGKPVRRSVAVDALNVYAADNFDVYKCPIAQTCTESTPATVADTALPNVVAMAVHGSTLYALGGTPFSASDEEKLWAVPTGGGSPTLLSSQVPESGIALHAYVLLADDDALYWNSYNGNLYTCARTDCQAKLLLSGADSPALAQDADHLYFIGGGEIYRLAKP